ncbi:MAG: citrate/2-methylcitrate synthase, partial [Lachnospiraceae bacterium]|nr:citrate/2-methylcitrate synthase [Lachnospiraceae bacterium]
MARETEYNEVDEKIFKQFLHSCLKSNKIDVNLYGEYDVKRGLRDSNGQGVLTGLTEISDVTGIKIEGGRKLPMDGKLYYQGYDVEDLVRSMLGRNFDFEEVSYLLLFGELPTKEQLENYITMKAQMQIIPSRFLRDVILKASSANVMNSLQRCIITLYTYDDRAEDISIENVLRQSIDLISKLPAIAVYSYRAYLHFRKDQTLIIRNPRPDYSTAENILYMMRADGKFTPLEAKVLDICLVLHAEHGGGNNSSFTDHVVTSSGTDTYSAIAASI